MGKIVYIPEEKLHIIREYFSDGNVNDNEGNNFVFFRDTLFIFNGDMLDNDRITKLIQKLFDAGYQNLARKLEMKRGGSFKGSKCDYIVSMLSKTPHIIAGFIKGDELHLVQNNFYDVLNSPEYKKLMKSGKFNKVFYSLEQGYGERLVYSSDNEEKTWNDWYLPNVLYHGTNLRYALGIVRNGLKPQPSQSNFKMGNISHDDTVFLAKDASTAGAYAGGLARPNGPVDTLPVVIAYDTNAMDGNRFVVDYDIYNKYGLGKDDKYEKVIDNTGRRESIAKGKESEYVDVNKRNPMRYNRVGYRGVVMPSAISKIYVFLDRYDALNFISEWEYDSVDDFLKGVEEIKRFMGDNSFDLDESKVKPPFEKDEFEIGAEGGANDYFHINEGYGYVPDLSEIGAVNYEWDFDEDEYQEWLADAELEDSPENRMEYISDNVSFDLSFLDPQTFHTFDSSTVGYDTLVSEFGEKKAEEIVQRCMEDGSGEFETCELFSADEFDINNPEELNKAVLRQMQHGEYVNGARGFILTDGSFVYTPNEHNQITIMNGINDKFQFIRLGNIRVLPDSIDIGKEPTPQQKEVLRSVISSCADGELYVDIMTDGGDTIGAHYYNPDWRYVMGEIDRYYREGIKPQGRETFGEGVEGRGVIVENSFEGWFRNSVLKDEDGKPLKMYHGSDKEFSEFSKEHIGGNGSFEGYGFNFTPYETRAMSYSSKNVIEAYLRAEKPMTSKSHNISVRQLMSIMAELDKGKPYTDTIVAAYEPPTYREKWDDNYYRRALPVAAKTIYDYNMENDYGDAGIYAEICLNGNADKYQVIDLFERLGYDSVIFYNDDKIYTVIVFEPNQIKRTSNQTFNDDSSLMDENLEAELDQSEVNLSSFRRNDELAPRIWNGFDLNPKVRLRLLDIADDFWEETGVNWVKPKGIMLTGSICNFNWSKFSDIDLHLVVDFSEVDERADFVQQYFDDKKNLWNESHKKLKIYGYPVELYVEDINAETASGGIYDLEENKWVKKPNVTDIKEIGPDKYEIKHIVAKYGTMIDNLCDKANETDDRHELEVIGKKAKLLWSKIKRMRKFGLERSGESDPFNIAYKCYRRMGYLDKLFDIRSELYDRVNSIGINESVGRYLKVLKENEFKKENVETFYRGFNGRLGEMNNHMLWLTDDIEYAKEYGDTVMEYQIDMDKVHSMGLYGMEELLGLSDDWHYIDGVTKEQADILLKNGCNGYDFYCNGDDSYCLCLWDNEPIISKKVVTLTEDTIINDEVVADGNSEHNVYSKRWKQERQLLKRYIMNYGILMTSKENGKTYKCLFDKMISSYIGVNYCLCLQYNQYTGNVGTQVYVRALDKFTQRMFSPETDTRGMDNVAGTSDDITSI